MSLVQNEVFNSGFFAIPNAVSILSGSDEGIYSWLTLNLLLKALHFSAGVLIILSSVKHYSGDLKRLHKVAAFDLGGGSTQVTYMPDDREVFATHPQYERTLSFFEKDINLFTHRFASFLFYLYHLDVIDIFFSFLGNGLVSARFGVLSRSTSDKGKVCA